MGSVSWSQVWGHRLARHTLLRRAPGIRLVEVVGAVCGIHAQVMGAAELSIGVRVTGVTRQDVRSELWERRTLVKTYGIRGTVHLFPAGDLPLWMAAARARGFGPQEQKRLGQMGLDRSQLEAIVETIGEALDGRRLTQQQLGDEVAARLGSWVQARTAPAWGGAWPRWRMALGWAASAGLLCFGPNAGNQVTFVRPDQWVGEWRDLDPGGALAEAFRRYLLAYGPATTRDFAQWFGVSPREAAELPTALGGQIREVEVEGERRLALSTDRLGLRAEVEDSVRLLPLFDCYVRGCHPRDRLIPPWAQRAVVQGGIGQIPDLLIDGVVAGVWEQRRRGDRVEVTVEPFLRLTAHQRVLLEGEAARIGEVQEAEATLTVGPVAARPHL